MLTATSPPFRRPGYRAERTEPTPQHNGVPAQPGLPHLAAFTLVVLVTGPFVRARLAPGGATG
jgi:hypothetical protein